MTKPFQASIYILFSLFSFSIANAQTTTYTYQGNYYDNFLAPYDAISRVTSSIELSAPLPNNATTDLTATLQTFSFTDGQATRDQTNTVVCNFIMTTNAQGQIDSWSIFLRQNDTGATENQHSLESISSIPVDQSGFSQTQGVTGCGTIGFSTFGAANTTPPANAWQGGPQLPAVSVPTLSTTMLLMLAILFLVTFIRGFNSKMN